VSVYKRGSVYHYAFSLRGHRYRGTTEQRTKSAAEMVEAQLKMEARARKLAPGIDQSLIDLLAAPQGFEPRYADPE